jgi:alkylated DNA repair dioxygenase AlkB
VPDRPDRSTTPANAQPAGPAIDASVPFERTWLDDGAWVDVARGWLRDSDAVFRAVLDGTDWQQGRIYRYDHWVEEPRMGAAGRPGPAAAHPALTEAHRALQTRYGVTFGGFGLARYRDGRDGQAFHRDRDMRWLDDTIIALLTLGARRPWLLRPRANRYAHELDDHGAVLDLAPGPGDLLVMGGGCQDRWEHSVAKVRRPLGERISVQWRWTSGRGRPVQGASYRAPRHYSR